MDELHPDANPAADNRPALILLHAFPLDRRMWRPQIEVFGPQVPFAALDLPGFGESRDAEMPPDLDVWADAIVAALDQGFGNRRYILAGLSMGGYVALRIVARHRARVAGLILADTRATGDSKSAKKGRNAAIELIRRDGLTPFVDDLVPKLVGPETSGVTTAEIINLAMEQKPESVVAALQAMRNRPDSADLLSTLDLPTLIMVGEHDLLTPQTEAEAMTAAMPDASLRVIQGAGHLSSIERPEAFTTGMANFLNERFSSSLQ
jgi:3-oxoadipate enol-lactonase